MGDEEAETDARETLTQLAAAIERHFRTELLGLYLFGSLAAGGFYAGKSDIDLMAIIAVGVEEGPQLEELTRLHDAFVSERPTWVERIEVAYVERGRSCERSGITHAAASPWYAPASRSTFETRVSS